nr:uncharacterized protein LOC112940866 [Solanum lycopersicum]
MGSILQEVTDYQGLHRLSSLSLSLSLSLRPFFLFLPHQPRPSLPLSSRLSPSPPFFPVRDCRTEAKQHRCSSLSSPHLLASLPFPLLRFPLIPLLFSLLPLFSSPSSFAGRRQPTRNSSISRGARQQQLQVAAATAPTSSHGEKQVRRRSSLFRFLPLVFFRSPSPLFSIGSFSEEQQLPTSGEQRSSDNSQPAAAAPPSSPLQFFQPPFFSLSRRPPSPSFSPLPLSSPPVSPLPFPLLFAGSSNQQLRKAREAASSSLARQQ